MRSFFRSSSRMPLVRGAAALGATLAASCTNSLTLESRAFQDWSSQERASRTDVKPLSFEPGDALLAELGAGSIVLRTAGGAAPECRAVVTTFGKTKEDAVAALEGVRVKVERDARGVSIRTEFDAAVLAAGTGGTSRVVNVALELSVPEGTALDLRTGSGEIRAAGPLGPCRATTQFGAVSLENVKGDVYVKSGSGNVSIARVEDAKSISSRSGFGSVKLSACQAESIGVETSSGAISAETLRAPEIVLGTSFGQISVSRVGGRVHAKSSSGSITIEDVVQGPVHAESGFGSVRVRRASGGVTAKSSSGEVEVSEIQGSAEVASGFGRVAVRGILTSVRAKSNSGSVVVEASRGSSLDGAWDISSGYGSVEVALPENASGALDARTGFGVIECDFPVLVRAGAKPKAMELRGTLNPQPSGVREPDDKFSLSVHSSSGNVKIRKS